MAPLPTGTVTFLFTDIEGSTRLLQHLGDRYAEVLTAHHSLLRSAIQNFHGHEIGAQGDALFVAFPRAKDALLAALAAQRALQTHPWPEGIALRVRMSIHTGEPLSSVTGYVGMDVHRAARICAAGHGNQILLSQTTRDLVADVLPNGVSLRDLREHRLKDLAQPHRLFQVLAADMPADFAPLRTFEARPHNLPIHLTSFIGRAREIVEIKQALVTSRLVTLTGAGGVGKTRLALQLVAELLERYPDGVWLAELASLSDQALVLKTVTSALNVAEQPGCEINETLVNALRPKALLLILDNCEHVLEACAQVADELLQACPQVRILATSRQELGVRGEVVKRVPSLSLPDLRRFPAIKDLVQYEAVRLFIDRVSFIRPGFAITPSNAAIVAQVCTRLDGIPLAIELAAARVKMLPIDEIARRLDDQLKFLTGGSRTAPPRQQTLQAVMDWSYDLLSAKERTLLRRLSIFAGGWKLETAEAVCADGVIEASEILDLLTRLLEKSLMVEEEGDGERRFRLLETVRQYAKGRLLESGEADSLSRRHRDHYLAMAERAERELRGPKEEAWLERLEADHENLRLALECSLGKGEIESGLRLAGALWWFWLVRGHLTEGNSWLEKMLSANPDAHSIARARALRATGVMKQRQGDYEQARVLLEESLSMFKGLEDNRGIPQATSQLGLLSLDQGNYEQATTLLEESVARFQALGDKGGMAVSLNHLGEAARCRGQHASARFFYEESLALRRELGDERGTAVSLANLANVAAYEHDHKAATRLYKESLSQFIRFGDIRNIAENLAGLATVAENRKDYQRAARLLGAGQGLLDFIGARVSSADLPGYEQSFSIVRTALGEEKFTIAWAEGRAMTLDQATEYALSEIG